MVTADERRRSLEERLVAARRDLATAEHAGKRGVLVRALRNEIAKLEEQIGEIKAKCIDLYTAFIESMQTGREIEDVLSEHSDVAMVAVVGVPDDKWGEAVTAMIVAREGARPNAEELINLVKARKGSAHAPKHVRFVSELPMTGVGKVDKKVLKAGFWVGRDRLVG